MHTTGEFFINYTGNTAAHKDNKIPIELKHPDPRAVHSFYIYDARPIVLFELARKRVKNVPTEIISNFRLKRSQTDKHRAVYTHTHTHLWQILMKADY